MLSSEFGSESELRRAKQNYKTQMKYEGAFGAPERTELKREYEKDVARIKKNQVTNLSNLFASRTWAQNAQNADGEFIEAKQEYKAMQNHQATDLGSNGSGSMSVQSLLSDVFSIGCISAGLTTSFMLMALVQHWFSSPLSQVGSGSDEGLIVGDIESAVPYAALNI